MAKKFKIPWNKGKKTGYAPWKGKKFSQTHKENLSKSHIGKPTHRWTEEQRRKLSQKRMGAGSPNWKGGISAINERIRKSVNFKLWREAVFKRDNFTCVWCGIKGQKGLGRRVVLHPDHIKPFCDYPELRFAIDNGRTLCIDCHKKTDTFGNNKTL